MSILTDALVTEFVRATNDMTPKEDVTAKESYLYGTVKSVGTL